MENDIVIVGGGPSGLQDNIDTYNQVVTNGDEGFETKRLFETKWLFYVAKVEPTIHMTKGGVKTNEFGQVLTVDGEVVLGLYGAGEVTWQSGGYCQSVVFGIIAGKQAATNIN